MVEIGRTLGIRTADELREAPARADSPAVPGSGRRRRPGSERRSSAPAAPRPGALLLNRSRTLVEEIAAALGGEPAGEPRRWRDASERLAVVVASEDPGPSSPPSRRSHRSSPSLPPRRGAPRRHRRGRPGGARGRRAGPLRDGARARDRLGGLRGRARAAARRARRGGRLPRARDPVVPARAPRGALPRRAAGAPRALRPPR